MLTTTGAYAVKKGSGGGGLGFGCTVGGKCYCDGPIRCEQDSPEQHFLCCNWGIRPNKDAQRQENLALVSPLVLLYA